MSDAKSPGTFEDNLARLEEIVHLLEDGRLPLSASLAHYEEGVSCLRACYESLKAAERKIELLVGVDASGNPVTETFDDPDETLDEKQQNRSRKRARKPAPAADEGEGKSPPSRIDTPKGLF